MFVMNDNLAKMRGEDPAPYPWTESQLVSKMVSGPKGSLTIVPVDGKVPENIESILGCGKKTGVYGTVIRRLLHDSGHPADYMFNGYEACMGECLMGKDALLMCDKDCLDMVEDKIKVLKTFGSDIKYEIRE